MKDSLLIVGTGALATLFAAKLAAAGVDVTMLGTWQEGLVALAKEGARIDDGPGVPVRVTGDPSECSNISNALVLVKSWQTGRAGQQLQSCLAERGVAVTLQNGLGNDERLIGILGRERVARGVTTVGATLLGPGHVHAGGNGKVVMEENYRLPPIRGMLRIANIVVEIVKDIQPFIWEKLIINVAINPLTGLLRVRNGDLLGNPPARIMMKRLAEEAARVAEAHGIELPFNDPEKVVEEAAKRSADNRSSMLQDLLRGSETEVEAINGVIVRLGEKYHLPVDFNRALWLLVKAISVRGNILDM
jgi:2-dehydropantoate 2-reductase